MFYYIISTTQLKNCSYIWCFAQCVLSCYWLKDEQKIGIFHRTVVRKRKSKKKEKLSYLIVICGTNWSPVGIHVVASFIDVNQMKE